MPKIILSNIRPLLSRPLWPLLFCLLLCACGSGGSSDAPGPGRNVHPEEWTFLHGSALGGPNSHASARVATTDLISCQVCHGEDFRGNGAAVSCFNCHFGGPPFFIHPPPKEPALPWAHPVNHGSWAEKDLRDCQGCHGQDGGPGDNPRFNTVIGDLEAGCESTFGCHNNFNDPFASFENGHNEGAAHPAYDPTDPAKQDLLHWYGEQIEYVDDTGTTRTYNISHYDAGNLEGACSLCHGADLQGGVGPACLSCHVVDPVVFPNRCASCHGSPTGDVDRFIDAVERTEPFDPIYLAAVSSGTHLQHEALACEERDAEEDCRVCHINSATGWESTDLRTNVNRHHLLFLQPIPDPPPPGVNGEPGFGNTYSCLTCHQNVNPGGGFGEPFRDCTLCHPGLLPDLPCPEPIDHDPFDPDPIDPH